MSTTTAVKRPPETITLEDGSRAIEAQYQGVSMRGLVYRSARGDAWYRVIPVEDAPLDWRHDIRTHRPPAADAIVAAQADWQQLIDDVPYLVVAYPAAQPGRSLAEILEQSLPEERVIAAVAVLRTLGALWQAAPPPHYLMPADIVLTAAGDARWLWLPPGPPPKPADVYREMERVCYLAPELLRHGAAGVSDGAAAEGVERFSVGACLIQAYCQLPATDAPATALQRAAGATLLAQLKPRPDLPPWLERFPDHRNTLSLLRRLLAPAASDRAAIDLRQLAERLDRLRHLFDPRAAVSLLRDRTEPKAALDLLQELFPLAESLRIDLHCQYDLLCIAGELSASYLQRSLEAIDYYERAVALQPQAPTALREQLRLIAHVRHHLDLATLLEVSPGVATEIDVKLWRNYRALHGERQTHAMEEAGQQDDILMAEYLLLRRQYETARDFIYPRLCDARGEYAWWDFGLNLAYVKAFIGLETGDGANLARAQSQLTKVKEALSYLHQAGTMSQSLIQQFGQEVAALELAIFRMTPAGNSPTTITPIR